MKKKDFQIPELPDYDKDLMKTSILDLITERNISQANLADLLGVSNTRISNCLNTCKAEKFTLEEIVKIAYFLHVSLDEIFGINPKKKTDNEITLTEIFQILFDLDDIINIDLEKIPPVLLGKNLDCGIYINNKVINKYLTEWKQLKSMKIDKEMKENLISLWKKDLLEKGKSITKENGFKEDEDQE